MTMTIAITITTATGVADVTCCECQEIRGEQKRQFSRRARRSEQAAMATSVCFARAAAASFQGAEDAGGDCAGGAARVGWPRRLHRMALLLRPPDTEHDGGTAQLRRADGRNAATRRPAKVWRCSDRARSTCTDLQFCGKGRGSMLSSAAQL